jgi:integrase
MDRSSSSTRARQDATGNVFCRAGKWYSRTPLGGGKRHVGAMPWATSEHEARERARLLASFAVAVRATGDAATIATLPSILDRTAAATAPADLDNLRGLVSRIVAGLRAPSPEAAPVIGETFESVARAWFTGELAKVHPDHVKVKRSADDDESRLVKHVFPVVGRVPLRAFGVEHAEKVLGALPSAMAPNTRRNVAQAINRILRMAVYPLRLIQSNPLPSGWMPRVPKASLKKQAMPYPREVDALVSSSEPVGLRLLVGFLAREGMRREEAEALSWTDLDLAHGLVRLERNKTNDARSWALRPGTARALRHWHELRGNPKTGPVFTDEQGSPVRVRTEDYRAALQRAGATRPELQGSATTKATGLHALRALFVTEALMRGESERWISDRTGHKSTAMISVYHRAARTFAEVRMTPLADLDVAMGWERDQTPLKRDRTPPKRMLAFKKRRANAIVAGPRRPPRGFLNRRSQIRVLSGAPTQQRRRSRGRVALRRAPFARAAQPGWRAP